MAHLEPKALPRSEPGRLRALYARVHWLHIADLERTIASLDAEPDQGSVLIGSALCALHRRVKDDQAAYDYYAERTDAAALAAMCLFIENKAKQECVKEAPEFAFLYDVVDAGY